MLVKELVAELQKFDPDATVFSFGPDSGGYDVVTGYNVVVRRYDEKNPFVGHFDDESAWNEAYYGIQP